MASIALIAVFTTASISSFSGVPEEASPLRCASGGVRAIFPKSSSLSDGEYSFMLKTRVRQSEPLFDGEQILLFCEGNPGIRDSKLLADQQRPAIGLKVFGIPLGMSRRIGPADDSVIPKQDCVVVLAQMESPSRQIFLCRESHRAKWRRCRQTRRIRE